MKVGDLVKHKGWEVHGIVVKLVREGKYTSKHDLYMILCTDGHKPVWSKRDCEVVNSSEATSL